MPLTPETALRKDRTQPTAPKFQHRHFAAIAAVIAELPDDPYSPISGEGTLAVARAFANALQDTNPNFDRNRFLRACGVL